jgi:hypothetical protein
MVLYSVLQHVSAADISHHQVTKGIKTGQASPNKQWYEIVIKQ